MIQAQRKYFNSIAAEWNEMAIAHDRICDLAQKIPLRAGDIVLDVGAGTGNFAQILSRSINSPRLIFVMDSAWQMLYYARQKQYACKVAFLFADAHWLPVHEVFLDHVICFEVFPHLQHADNALREFHRVLKSNGRITIAHCSGSDRVNAIHAQIGGPVAHDFLPKVADLVRMLTRVGFCLLAAEESEAVYFVQAQKQE